jgi:hypothetical protein
MKWLLCVIFLLPIFGHSQMVIDDVGDNWKKNVDSALSVIKKYDIESYEVVINNCKLISFWMGGFSTTQDSTTILISVRDMNIKSINNLACIIVHESKHLDFLNKGIKMDPSKEEFICYTYEYEFLEKIPNIEYWLRTHVITNMMIFSKIK